MRKGAASPAPAAPSFTPAYRAVFQDMIKRYNPEFESRQFIFRERNKHQIPVAQIVAILEKDGKQRTFEELQFLSDELSLMAFFEKVQVSVGARLDFCKACNVKKYAQHEVLFEEGQIGDSFFIVIEGSLIVKKRVENSLEIKEVAHIVDGETVGELSLLHGRPRLATVQAEVKTVCLEVKKKDYDTLVRPWHLKEEAEIAGFLRIIKAFESWSPDQLAFISSKFVVRRFRARDILIHQSQVVTDLYIIYKGQSLAVRAIDGDEDKTPDLSNSSPVGELWRGDLILPASSLKRNPAPVSVYAVTLVDVLSIPLIETARNFEKETIDELMRREPEYPPVDMLATLAARDKKWKMQKSHICKDALRNRADRLIVGGSAAAVAKEEAAIPKLTEESVMLGNWDESCLEANRSPPKFRPGRMQTSELSAFEVLSRDELQGTLRRKSPKRRSPLSRREKIVFGEHRLAEMPPVPAPRTDEEMISAIERLLSPVEGIEEGQLIFGEDGHEEKKIVPQQEKGQRRRGGVFVGMS